MSALDFVSNLPTQLHLLLTEELVHKLYDTLPQEEADAISLRIVRSKLYNNRYPSEFTSESDRLLFDLICEKTCLFGRSMFVEDGDEDV